MLWLLALKKTFLSIVFPRYILEGRNLSYTTAVQISGTYATKNECSALKKKQPILIAHVQWMFFSSKYLTHFYCCLVLTGGLLVTFMALITCQIWHLKMRSPFPPLPFLKLWLEENSVVRKNEGRNWMKLVFRSHYGDMWCKGIPLM